jgi:acyl-homoserine lactone acylase PvdQ
MFPVNLAGADVDGNIFYFRAGRVPIRPAGQDWTKPVPGNTSATAWRGIRRGSDLIQLVNPPQGYLLNTNSAPDAMVTDGSITADKYPADVFNAQPGRTTTRGLIGTAMLKDTFAATHAELVERLFDEHWLGADAWLKALSAAIEAEPKWPPAATAAQRDFLRLVLAFDGRASADSPYALAYFFWQQAIPKAAAASGVDLYLLNDKGLAGRALATGEAAVLRAAIVGGQAEFQRLYGASNPVLGDEFRIGRGGVSLPVGACTRAVGRPPGSGSWDTVFMPPQSFRAGICGPADAKGVSQMLAGQSHPHLMVMTRPIQSYSAYPYGQSDVASSRHYSDQSVLYSERRLKPTYFNPGELKGHTESVKTLTWNGRP